MAQVWRMKDNLQEAVLFFYHVGFQVGKHGSKSLYLLSYLVGPRFLKKF